MALLPRGALNVGDVVAQNCVKCIEFLSLFGMDVFMGCINKILWEDGSLTERTVVVFRPGDTLEMFVGKI